MEGSIRAKGCPPYHTERLVHQPRGCFCEFRGTPALTLVSCLTLSRLLKSCEMGQSYFTGLAGGRAMG